MFSKISQISQGTTCIGVFPTQVISWEFSKFSRIPILKNICERLLLKFGKFILELWYYYCGDIVKCRSLSKNAFHKMQKHGVTITPQSNDNGFQPSITWNKKNLSMQVVPVTYIRESYLQMPLLNFRESFLFRECKNTCSML